MNPGTAIPPRARSAARRPVKGKTPKKKFRWGRLFLYVFLLLLLGGGGAAAYLYTQYDSTIDKISQPGTISTIGDKPAQAVPPAESVKVKPVSVLLLGLDTRQKSGGLNTDVIMVATFNPNTKSATVVSIPRDTKIDLDNYKAHKANAYYARFLQIAHDEEGLKGDDAEIYARNEMKTMMSKYFGIPIQYTAIINFQGFSDVVDALGGVDVDVDMDMHYVDTADGTNINLKKGFQHLDGDQTLDFVRYRKSKDGKNMSSDFDRNKRQSDVLAELTGKMKSLSAITKVDNLFDAVGDNMTMDMPSKEITNMVKTYFGMSKENVSFVPLEGVWRSPYVYPNEDSLDQAKQALQNKAAE